MRRADLVRYWLPAVIWSTVLLLMSGTAGSTTVTVPILEWIIPRTHPMFDVIHSIVRKTAHVIAYALLGALDFHAVRGPRRGWALRWSISALVLAVSIATLDEWHQTIVPTRTGSASDVVIDAAGALIAQLGYRLRA